MNTAVMTRPADADAELGRLLEKPLPDEARNARRANMYLAAVADLQIVTQDDYDTAAEELRTVKEAWDTMEADRTSFTGPLNKLLDRLNARFQPYLKTLKQCETLLKEKMAGFIQAEQRRIAEARAEAERIAAAERQRVQAEAAALREKADAATDAAARQAAHERAEALEQVAAVSIAQPVVQILRKGAGITTPKTIDFEVVDLLALVRFIGSTRPDLVELLKVDEPRMRKLIKALGVKTKIDGVRVFEKTGISVSRAS